MEDLPPPAEHDVVGGDVVGGVVVGGVPYGGLVGHDPTRTTAENYRLFAERELAGRSPAYEALARAVAEDDVILAFLGTLPPDKRQPNLLFAAARSVLGEPAGPASLRALIRSRSADLATVMRTRRTQTNEAARCALMLPALCALPQPLALVEVGAAAGLTLLPDRYSYDYGGHLVSGLDAAAPTLPCRPIGPVPLPAQVPTVVWRAGIDLNPLDVSNHDDVAWLSCLLWPGEEGRSERLTGAVDAARRARPRIWQGDLLDDLHRVASTAPSDATLVVYHSAVLAYVSMQRRQQFAVAIRQLGAVWLSLEGAGVLPDIEGPDDDDASFLLVRDGAHLLATADGHGQWLRWLDDPGRAQELN